MIRSFLITRRRKCVKQEKMEKIVKRKNVLYKIATKGYNRKGAIDHNLQSKKKLIFFQKKY